jgi:hypothetical protein
VTGARVYAAPLGLACIGLLSVFGRMDSSESWVRRTQSISGILLAAAILLEFVQACDRHYLQQTMRQNIRDPVEPRS